MNPVKTPPYFCWAILAMLTGAQFNMSLGAYAWGPLAPFLLLGVADGCLL